MPNQLVEDLLNKITAKNIVVGVIGLGYVGLPLASAFGNAGVSVLGFDLDPTKVDQLNRGESYINHPNSEEIARLRNEKLLEATSDMSRLGEPDALIICVPTPITRHLAPDLSYVEATTEMIAERLREGQLVVLESTTYPGTTSDIVAPRLEGPRLKCGEHFFLAYSPEREDPGNIDHSTTHIPKVIGADDPQSLALADALYSLFAPCTVPVSTAATAEAVKITENVFRAVNIALVNELKVVFSAMGIDIWEVIEAAKTKPFGYMPFYPGPGLGGHCIPIDPFYLTWKAREFGQNTQFIELAGRINSNMPQYVTQVLTDALNAKKLKGLKGSRILLVGVAYKKNVDDVRESPALSLISIFESKGALVDYFDPYVPVIRKERDGSNFHGRESIRCNSKKISQYDAVIIVTDHDSIDYQLLHDNADLIVDTRNALAGRGITSEKVFRA